jgi:ligand-binding sensor domain-containing protein
MSKPQYLFIILLLIASVYRSPVSAQANAGYETISTAQGLSQGLINDILQDKDGFIWIATKGGINRYDGYTFKTFTTDPQDTNSISSNAVSNLLEDRLGRLWIGTYDGGVNVYDKNTGRFQRIVQKNGSPYGLSGNRIESGMVALPDGRMLVCPQGTAMNIVSLSAKKNSQPLVTQLNAPGNRVVQGAAKDDKGFIWIGCTDGSFFIYTPASGTFELLSDGYTFTKLIEKTGTRLTARASQVFLLKPPPYLNIRFRDQKDQLMPGIISYNANGATMIDNRIPLKTGASGKLFYDFGGLRAGDDINKARVYDLHSTDSSQNIKCLLLDRSGVLWVGMLGQGLYKYRIGNNRFKPVLPKMSIQRVSIFKKDIVYIQGWGSTTTLAADGSECVNPLKPIVGKDPAVSVLHARNGEYWIYWLVSKTLLRYNAGLKLLAAYPNPVNPASTEQMQPMIEDSRHRIWLCGTNGTLAMVDPATDKLSRFVINIEQTAGTSVLAQTTAFYEDKAGVFWLGTEHGFARLMFKDDAAAPEVKWFKNIPGNRNSLGYNYVSWFMDDAVNPDYLWVSTKGGGLNHLQKSTGNFTHYTTKQGLPNDVVYGTITDKAGNIWGSTNRGLFCMLASGKKNDDPVIRVFGTSDGLQADEFNTNAFGKLTNGDLVFGGVNGINIFSPQKILAASFTPNVFITGILIGNKQLAPGDNTGVLQQTIEKTNAITLSHLQDVLTLEFSALDFTAPQQNKYRYQLVGIDNEWVESGTRRTATYLHLPSGKYLFKVQGSNSQGIWSHHIAQLNIQVLPPWWLSWWAYVTYALVVALAIRGYLKFNVNKAKLRSQLSYEQLEAKRVKELDTIKTQLYTNITHEFRTPLTVILGMAQQLTEKPAELFDSRMDMIMRNGRNLLNLVNQMLDLSKLETGKMELQLVRGDVIHFLRYVVESFHSLAESQQKQLHF